MKRPARLLTLACLWLCCGSCGRAQQEGATRTAAAVASGAVSEFRLPEPWMERREGVRDLQFAHVANLEARRAQGAPPGEYLIAGFAFDNDYAHEFYRDIPPPHYTANVFAVDFNENFRVRPASRREWDAAARVSTKPHWVMLHYKPEEERGEFVYRGFTYRKSGEYFRAPLLLSPTGRWLAVFSYSGRKTQPNLIFGGGEPRTGDVFWDVYDAMTGERVARWEARGVDDPASFNRASAWVGERHLLTPSSASARSFLVFTLPEPEPFDNPAAVSFPAWLAEDGRPARLPDPRTDRDVESSARAYEARMLSDPARPGARELLFRLKDEWVELLPPTPPRGLEGPGPRGKRLRTAYSRSVYAVTLDGRYAVRGATEDEWGRARKVEATQNRLTLEETYESFGGTRRVYRPFRKTGEVWGSPKALSAEWLAVFSHTPGRDARAQGQGGAASGGDGGGVLHVEIYDARPGNLILSARRPHAGPADALFRRALWLDGHFLVIPLDESYGSCLLFMLPETGMI